MSERYLTRSRARSSGVELTDLFGYPDVENMVPSKRRKLDGRGKTIVSSSANIVKFPVSGIPVFQDSTSGDLPMTKMQPEPTIPSASKARQKLADIGAKVDNARNISVPLSYDPISVATSVTKLAISSEELNMNGAPEGDLYEVTLLKDDELEACTEAESNHILSTLKSIGADSKPLGSMSWAQVFDHITTLRRVLRYSPQILDSESEIAASMFITNAVESLRSTTVRNGLLCMKQFVLTHALTAPRPSLVLIVHCIVKRCHHGPKFVTALAEEIIPCITTSMPVEVLMSSFTELIENKSVEINKKVYSMIGSIVDRINVEEEAGVRVFLVILHQGLRSKSADSRVSSKKAFINYRERIPELNFETFLRRFFAESDACFILQEISQSKSVSSAKSVMTGFRRQGVFNSAHSANKRVSSAAVTMVPEIFNIASDHQAVSSLKASEDI